MSHRAAVNQVGTFRYYTDEDHRDLAAEYGLHPIVVRDSYKQAAEAAALEVLADLMEWRITEPVRFIHHLPGTLVDDPASCVGSWGWKTVG